MKFQYRIIIVTLVILVTTLLLNSVLSLASFEKLYVSSLISTYEVAGKDLKRKIDQSLKFGKPLEKFKGMNLLIQDMMEKNPEISSVAICTLDGKILYHSNTGQVGETIAYKPPEFDPNKIVFSKLVKGSYLTFLPLQNRSQDIVGLINLSFSRDVVYNKLKSMAKENLKALWVLMLLTSTGLVIMITMIVVRPIKSEILNIGNMLEWFDDLDDSKTSDKKDLTKPPTAPAQDSQPGLSVNIGSRLRYLDIKKIKNEVDRLAWHIYQFVTNAFTTYHRTAALSRGKREILTDLRRFDLMEEKVSTVLKMENLPITDNEQQHLDDLLGEGRVFRKSLTGILEASQENKGAE